ncbi:MAG: glutathione S-transferase [Oleiphilaceae bacterium]|jgi:glutathione S-transferase
MMGFFSRKKNNSSQEITLLGLKGQVATMKCLLMAGLKEVSLKTTVASSEINIDQIKSYQYISKDSVAKSPTLTQGDFSVSGTRAILTFLDVRGKGASLEPKKARTLGLQNYWIDVCHETLAPAAQAVVQGRATEKSQAGLKKLLFSLNSILAENQYIVGQISFAEPNIAAYIYLLRCSDYDMTTYPNIGNWISRLEEKMSGPLNIDFLPSQMQPAGQVA